MIFICRGVGLVVNKLAVHFDVLGSIPSDVMKND